MKTHTIIIGAGIVGGTLALKLAKAKHHVTLIDARPDLDTSAWQEKLAQRDARVYALSLASIELLKSVDVWQYIEQSERKADYTQMQVWQTNGIGELYFSDGVNNDSANKGKNLLGSMVEPVVIEHAIHQALQNKEVAPYLTLISGKKVSEMDWLGEKKGYRVVLSNGESYQAQLLIGADGRGSSVRNLAGIELDRLDYEQTAICCAIRTQKPHLATARQAMLPTGTLALLPLADITEIDKANPQHWQSVVWTLPTQKAIDLLLLNDAQIAKKLAFASSYELGNIEQIESIASFPLTAQQAKTYIKSNLALVGDSAHGVHPLAGQGLNLGLLDVIELANRLIYDYKRSHGKQWGHWHTLQRYEQQRKANNSVMMHSFSLINWLFAGEFAQITPIQHIRSEGMALVGKTKPLMRWFTQRASGL